MGAQRSQRYEKRGSSGGGVGNRAAIATSAGGMACVASAAPLCASSGSQTLGPPGGFWRPLSLVGLRTGLGLASEIARDLFSLEK